MKSQPTHSVHESSLICNLPDLKSGKAKVTGIVFDIKYNDNYLDIIITDGTGDVECSVFLDKHFRQCYEIPKIGQIVLVLGAYKSKISGNKVFAKIKVLRYSVINDMDKYMKTVIGNLSTDQDDKDVEIICAVKKKPSFSKLFSREARNLVFVSALKVLEHNPQFKHWTFSKDGIKNQMYVKKYLTAKKIPQQQGDKGISESISHFLKFRIIEESEGSRYTIHRQVYQTLQEQAMRVIANCGANGINYNYLIELLHRKMEIEKESDFIFNAEGLSKLMGNYITEGKVVVHQNRLISYQ